ncbi:hypothetical protein SAMN05660909_03386 [Chitinophaga terrae (ex Kim and Jung 2007)]|uniref:Uncharacterized protein n=1 Tax=Chitinophaga terrae (ex Kim and Jung 2007) TaxID=408074 RepID=A0A1H4DXN9_9BACT|nr:hypothetical protein [Chitinophaga terrae (ex Kim and Jung 2007)]SEA77521.1 hypothetical protein SAMN05660909_03386 [Chitinophaga terrae (ex Kim and Jung 2007)]
MKIATSQPTNRKYSSILLSQEASLMTSGQAKKFYGKKATGKLTYKLKTVDCNSEKLSHF